MNVCILIREDQSDHGFIDTSIVGVFVQENDAIAVKECETHNARAAGSRVCGDQGDWDESDWEVSWTIEKRALR